MHTGSVAVIGGGASGLAAAVSCKQAARLRGAACSVTVFEATDRVGKSILASGNGRCNFSNVGAVPDDYHNAAFVADAFSVGGEGRVQGFFDDLGLCWREEANGWLYPKTNKASTVLDTLRFACRDLDVAVTCGKQVIAVVPVERGFMVAFDDDATAAFDAVIIACGGKVARSILSPAYRYLNTVPVLGPLLTDTDPIKGLDNIRVRCSVSCAGRTEAGEVLFRDYGVSGIAVFNLSRFARPGDSLEFDFVPEIAATDLCEALARRQRRFGGRPAMELLAGMVLPQLVRAVLRSAHIDPEKPLPESALPACSQALKGFAVQVKGIGDHRQCQVRRGGFAVDCFDPMTMESKLDRGLFVVGEALDIDAPCGGYNLHWAWLSGIIAGEKAASAPCS